jgi:hypothetical protein
MERDKRVELFSLGWKPKAQPHIPIPLLMAPSLGIEPSSVLVNSQSHTPCLLRRNGSGGRSLTCNLLGMSQVW